MGDVDGGRECNERVGVGDGAQNVGGYGGVVPVGVDDGVGGVRVDCVHNFVLRPPVHDDGVFSGEVPGVASEGLE